MLIIFPHVAPGTAHLITVVSPDNATSTRRRHQITPICFKHFDLLQFRLIELQLLIRVEGWSSLVRLLFTTNTELKAKVVSFEERVGHRLAYVEVCV